jgi:hypothetical protein
MKLFLMKEKNVLKNTIIWMKVIIYIDLN